MSAASELAPFAARAAIAGQTAKEKKVSEEAKKNNPGNKLEQLREEAEKGNKHREEGSLSELTPAEILKHDKQGIEELPQKTEEEASSVFGWAKSLSRILSDLLKPSTWLRILMGILGIGLLAFAVFMFARGAGVNVPTVVPV